MSQNIILILKNKNKNIEKNCIDNYWGLSGVNTLELDKLDMNN